MKNLLIALLLFLFPTQAKSLCVEYEVYKVFIEQKFGMKLYSWAITNDGKETIWLYLNDHKHFAWITVDLRGCSILTMPEDQLSFFRKKNPPSYDPNAIMPMSRGEPL